MYYNNSAYTRTSDDFTLLILCLYLIGGVIALIIWLNIFKKAGFNEAVGCLMFIPLLNFLVLLYFAFAEWPIEKENRKLMHRLGIPTEKEVRVLARRKKEMEIEKYNQLMLKKEEEARKVKEKAKAKAKSLAKGKGKSKKKKVKIVFK